MFGNCFRSCYRLKKIILRNNKVCRLLDSNPFYECYHFLGTAGSTINPEGQKDGYVYVPDDLVEQYKVATNWVAYADRIKPLSELEE